MVCSSRCSSAFCLRRLQYLKIVWRPQSTPACAYIFSLALSVTAWCVPAGVLQTYPPPMSAYSVGPTAAHFKRKPYPVPSLLPPSGLPACCPLAPSLCRHDCRNQPALSLLPPALSAPLHSSTHACCPPHLSASARCLPPHMPCYPLPPASCPPPHMQAARLLPLEGAWCEL